MSESVELTYGLEPGTTVTFRLLGTAQTYHGILTEYEDDKAFVMVGDGKMAVNMAYPQDCDEDDFLIPSRVDEQEELIEMVTDIFKYHSPKNDGSVRRYENIREHGRIFALALINYCPISNEMRRAIEKVEEAVKLANAAIVGNE
jgi:hypothetical protein